MSRTDKDTPFRVRLERNEVGPGTNNWGPMFSSNFRKGKAQIKRQGHKNYRRGKRKFWDVKTVRTTYYFW